jgi:hypothetical protein
MQMLYRKHEIKEDARMIRSAILEMAKTIGGIDCQGGAPQSLKHKGYPDQVPTRREIEADMELIIESILTRRSAILSTRQPLASEEITASHPVDLDQTQMQLAARLALHLVQGMGVRS